MATDITPQLAADRQIINSYGDGGFRVSNQRFDGAILVTPLQTLPWVNGQHTDKLSALPEDAFHALFPIHETETGRIELLLIGAGVSPQFLPPSHRDALKERGIAIDVMDTGAACRTYNVLLLEDRRVAAALLPVGSKPA